MAEQTTISWTDTTFNSHIGCTRVSPGCDHCYAQALDHRFGGNHWVEPPRTLSDAYWKKLTRLHRQDQRTGFRRKVFSGSMCDWCDKNAPADQLERLWDAIRSTPLFHWQLLTKRAPRIKKCLPSDWAQGYDNVWLGVSVENIKHGLPRMKILKAIPAKVRFLSVEPLLEDIGDIDLTGIDWVVVGGESGPHARPMDAKWVRSIQAQCAAQGVPFFFKQWGARKGKDKGGCLLDGEEIKQWPVYFDNNHSLVESVDHFNRRN